MRAVVAMLLLLAIAPVAAAEHGPSHDAPPTLRLQGPDAPLLPLADVGRGAYVVRIDCAALDEGDAIVDVRVGQAPPWAEITLIPSGWRANASACVDGAWEGAGEVAITLGADAPAFEPGVVRVNVTVRTGEEAVSIHNETTVTARFYSILDVVLERSVVQVEPGEVAQVALTLKNHGNGGVRVTLARVDTREHPLVVAVPPPVVLQSRTGAPDETNATLFLAVQAQERFGYANDVAALSFRVTARYLHDPALVGDETTVSLVMQTIGWDTPAPGAAWLAGAAGLAALLQGFWRWASRK